MLPEKTPPYSRDWLMYITSLPLFDGSPAKPDPQNRRTPLSRLALLSLLIIFHYHYRRLLGTEDPAGSPHTLRRWPLSSWRGLGCLAYQLEKPIQEGHPIKTIMPDLAGTTSKLLIGWLALAVLQAHTACPGWREDGTSQQAAWASPMTVKQPFGIWRHLPRTSLPVVSALSVLVITDGCPIPLPVVSTLNDAVLSTFTAQH